MRFCTWCLRINSETQDHRAGQKDRAGQKANRGKEASGGRQAQSHSRPLPGPFQTPITEIPPQLRKSIDAHASRLYQEGNVCLTHR